MAAGDLNFNVGVDTAGAIRSVQNLNTALGNLTNAFRLTVAGISVGAIAKFSDEITSLKNRLMLLSDTQEQANNQFKALAAIAISSRTDVGATGDLYFRIARSAKELGISQAEAATITESLAKAMSASGLSARESAGPLLQLGQALQSGVFQGDELRSILEGLPPVAKALADNEQKIVTELNSVQGQKVDIGGYYRPDQDKLDAIMRPSPTFNQALSLIAA